MCLEVYWNFTERNDWDVFSTCFWAVKKNCSSMSGILKALIVSWDIFLIFYFAHTTYRVVDVAKERKMCRSSSSSFQQMTDKICINFHFLADSRRFFLSMITPSDIDCLHSENRVNSNLKKFQTTDAIYADYKFCILKFVFKLR